jgi:hypothetical protein
MNKLPFKLPPGFGGRQPSGAWVSQVSRLQSGSGRPQSKTLSRRPGDLNFRWHT